MSKAFKRFAGDPLNLSLDLFPAPTETKYARAFFFDKDGAALSPAFVNLIDQGGGRFTDTTIAMPSTSIVNARFEVYTDDQYSDVDHQYLGGTDAYELDSLLPTQLPGAPELEAEITTVELEAEITEGELEAEFDSGSLTAEIEESTDLDAELESTEVEAETTSTELEGEID